MIRFNDYLIFGISETLISILQYLCYEMQRTKSIELIINYHEKFNFLPHSVDENITRKLISL